MVFRLLAWSRSSPPKHLLEASLPPWPIPEIYIFELQRPSAFPSTSLATPSVFSAVIICIPGTRAACPGEETLFRNVNRDRSGCVGGRTQLKNLKRAAIVISHLLHLCLH